MFKQNYARKKTDSNNNNRKTTKKMLIGHNHMPRVYPPTGTTELLPTYIYFWKEVNLLFSDINRKTIRVMLTGHNHKIQNYDHRTASNIYSDGHEKANIWLLYSSHIHRGVESSILETLLFLNAKSSSFAIPNNKFLEKCDIFLENSYNITSWGIFSVLPRFPTIYKSMLRSKRYHPSPIQFFMVWEELEEPMHISRNPSIRTLPSLPAFIPFPFDASKSSTEEVGSLIYPSPNFVFPRHDVYSW